MHQYRYAALDPQGTRQQGTLIAASELAAMQALQERQLSVVALRRTGVAAAAAQRAGGRSGRPMSPAAVALLVGELATLLEAGVPLAEALTTLQQSQGDGHPLAGVLLAVRGGTAFSEALASSRLPLPDFVLQLVRAGESTGNLAAALRAAAAHLDAEVQFAQEARNALMYPMVLVATGILATLVMFVFVVPRFATILSNPKADLPLISQWVLGAGLWLTRHQVWVAVAVAAVVAAVVWSSKLPAVRSGAWEVAARLPVLRGWTLHAELARWASLFAVLLASKVPLLQALAQANTTLRRRSLSAQAALAMSDVRGGKALSQALADHAVLDGAGINLVRVGERAGSLPQTVASLARIHVGQSQTRLKRFLVLLEPLTILLLSVVLGGIMISVMLAITSLTNVL
jgi:type II secretory pathway component PulF